MAITETLDPAKLVTNPFWRNKSDERQNDTTVDSLQCELHLKSGVDKMVYPSYSGNVTGDHPRNERGADDNSVDRNQNLLSTTDEK